jgi:hypothetical protein
MLKGPWLQLILTVLTTLPKIIADVEATNPGVPGAGKKLQVLDKVKTALVEGDTTYGPLLANSPIVHGVLDTAVDVAVDVFNRSASVVAQEQANKLGTPTPGTPVAHA